ncbi:MAG: hypothetical protein RJA07_1338 [Bacteroidota bacterium]|jgi:hypothetical protein
MKKIILFFALFNFVKHGFSQENNFLISHQDTIYIVKPFVRSFCGRNNFLIKRSFDSTLIAEMNRDGFGRYTDEEIKKQKKILAKFIDILTPILNVDTLILNNTDNSETETKTIELCKYLEHANCKSFNEFIPTLNNYKGSLFLVSFVLDYWTPIKGNNRNHSFEKIFVLVYSKKYHQVIYFKQKKVAHNFGPTKFDGLKITNSIRGFKKQIR